MLTQEQQVKVDAIKAKYNYKPQAQAQAPKSDWFTATAPKPPLPFDIHNPTQESARATAANSAGVDFLKRTGEEAQRNIKEGGEALYKTAMGEVNPFSGAASIAKSATGALVAPITAAITPAFQGAVDKISDIPAVQKFAMEHDTGKLGGAYENIKEKFPTTTQTVEDLAMTGLNLSMAPVTKAAGTAVGVIAKDVSKGALDTAKPVLQTAKEAIPARPHPIDAMKGYVDTKVKASMKKDVETLLTRTKPLARKTAEFKARGTDFNEILSDPQIYQGLKVENGKIIPDDAIKVLDERIDPLIESKKSILPQIDNLVPTRNRYEIYKRAVEDIKGKFAPKVEQDLIERIKAQVEALPEMLKPSQIDRLRAQFRTSARDAQGQMKSTSEFAALENAARDTVFDITDNLPIKNAAEYKALNDYVKQMIQTKEFLNDTLRGQGVGGSGLGKYSGRLVGAMAGMTHGPLGAVGASYAGGVVADIITNNSLGSSFKMSLIRNITDDPAIISQAEKILKEVQDQAVINLPKGDHLPSNLPAKDTAAMSIKTSKTIDESIPQSPKKAIDDHIAVAEETLKNVPPEKMAEMGGLPALIEKTRTGIAEALEKQGLKDIATKIRELDLSAFKDWESFKAAVLDYVKNIQPGLSTKSSVPAATTVAKQISAGEFKTLKEWEVSYTSGKNSIAPTEIDMAVQDIFEKHGIENTAGKGRRQFRDEDAKAQYISDITKKYEESLSDGTIPKAEGAAPKTDMPVEDRTLRKEGKYAGSLPTFRGFEDITSKVIDDLKGRAKVSKQYLLDATNRADWKQAERDLVRRLLKDEPKDNIDAAVFANKVKTELLPLTRMEPGKLWGRSMGSRYESVNLPDELRGPVANYSEHIYNSPIKTSAGDVHFSGNTAAPNYFAHTRIEDLPDKQTRRVIEAQSDLFQKGRLETSVQPTQAEVDAVNSYYGLKGKDRYSLDRLPPSDDLKNIAKYGLEGGATEQGALRSSNSNLAKLEPYRNTWHERVIREEVKQAAKDGKTKLQFPTGETAMKIEGLGDTKRWVVPIGEIGNSRGVALAPNNMKVGMEIRTPGGQPHQADSWIITDVLGDGKFKAFPRDQMDFLSEVLAEKGMSGPDDVVAAIQKGKVPDELLSYTETFDISGKVDTSNPIYKFYDKEVARYLQKKYGATKVTDPQGVTWMEVKVPKEAKKLPVEAFGLGIGLGLEQQQ